MNDFADSVASAEEQTGHMWEIEFQPLGLLLARKNKGSIGGVDCYISRVSGGDFAGVLAGSVLQQIWRA